MASEIIMVIGAGQMGSGIAQAAAEAGYGVILHDVQMDFVKNGMSRIDKVLSSQVKKGKIDDEEKGRIQSRIKGSVTYDEARDAHWIIEAVFEDGDLKAKIFSALDEISRPETLFATNTSSIPITRLAASVKRADRFIGIHFFNPPQVMRLVEIIPGLKTSRETILEARRFVDTLKKESVLVKDVPGFLVNRINTALRLEAYNCLMEGVASLEDIDKALKLALGHPMGPFELADFVGLDVGLNVLKTLHDGYKDPKWRPSLLLEKLVLSGDLGRKSGKGWYDYTSGQKVPRTDVQF
ncbi:MAG: 3-hydroxyacyl-CoA dehydrogenase family protein [Deltaproteobacteria bacterium]|nr:3-hydroxyacyl-CoA dehydrogenase family protein [Deltaproteobacteria bacterium]